eukprot:scaffold318494_cov18-Tisochrysis_lutea.AAC.1
MQASLVSGECRAQITPSARGAAQIAWYGRGNAGLAGEWQVQSAQPLCLRNAAQIAWDERGLWGLLGQARQALQVSGVEHAFLRKASSTDFMGREGPLG